MFHMEHSDPGQLAPAAQVAIPIFVTTPYPLVTDEQIERAEQQEQAA